MVNYEIETLIRRFDGLVILDEAYNDFSEAPSFIENLNQYPNLIVLQTFSKAWGCAAIRLGMAFASPDIIGKMCIRDRAGAQYIPYSTRSVSGRLSES